MVISKFKELNFVILRVFYVKVENIYRLSKSDFGKEKYLYITMNGIGVSM